MADPSAEDHLPLAEAFLREAVYRSRGVQAGESLFAGGDPGPNPCGLGRKTAVALDLSPRGEELFASLWPDGLDPEALEALREGMADWVRRQDALDRKRNHFLKDFRGSNGFDRSAYSADQEAAYRRSLDAINGEEEQGRREAARRLLDRS